MRIKPLTESVANQIAAGEVIERPASVVKELVENAIDAGATIIDVSIEQGGLSAIVVTDNGHGIVKEDLPLAVSPHATSKIVSIDDLTTIHSFGFRGEALASISSVSEFSLTSKPLSQSEAYTYETQANGEAKLSPAAHPDGTTISVRQLFVNVPVRRKFLKREKTEFLHIEAVVKRMALANTAVSLRLSHNGKTVLDLRGGDDNAALKQRMGKLFGQAFVAQSVWVEGRSQALSVSGWLGLPSFMRGQNDLQYCYINHRAVKDKLISQVIRQVYEPLLYPGKVPSFLLYIELPSSEVDVNVHPAKSEVRFCQPRQVHDFLLSTLSAPIASTALSFTEPSGQRIKAARSASCSQTTASVSMPHSMSSSLIALGGQYALLLGEDSSMVFHVQTIYQAYLEEQITRAKEDGPLPSRPLLVPLTVSVKDSATFPSERLKDVGFEVAALTEQSVSVREIPLLCPHIDLQAMLQSVAEKHGDEAILQAMLTHQLMDFYTLSEEERGALARFLKQQPVPLKGCRLLRDNDWRGLVHG